MTELDIKQKKYKRSIIYIVIGALSVFAAVLFINKSEFFLNAETEADNWFIGAAIIALVGWVVVFVGIIGIVKNAPKRKV